MSVELVRPDRLELLHRRAARLVDEQRKKTELLEKFFAEIVEVRRDLRAAGSLWAGPVLSAPLQAALEALEDGRPAVDVDPLPLMELGRELRSPEETGYGA